MNALVEVGSRAVQLMEGETPASASFDIGTLISEMAQGVLGGIATTMTSLTPVITTITVIGFAIRLFKKYVK